MFINYPVLSRITLLILDTTVTVLSYIVAMHLRSLLGLSAGLEWKYYVHFLLIIMIIWGGLSEYQEAYAGRAYKSGRFISSLRSLRKEIIIILRIVLIGCVLVYCISYIINFFVYWEVPKSLLVIFGAVNITLLSVERVIIFKYMEYESKKEENIKKVLVLGTGDVVKQYMNSVNDEMINVLGLISIEKDEIGNELFGTKVIGTIDNLAYTLHTNQIDELVVAFPAKYLGGIEDIISTCDREGIPVRIVSPFFKNLLSKSRAEVAYGLPNIIFVPVERNDLEVAIKRVIDVIVSSISLVALSPLIMLIAFLIKIDSSGPIFYRWNILGLNKRPLTSYKFRTMVQNAEQLKNELMEKNEMKGAAFKMKNDPRITRVGKWLRKYSLDELPQLWSVLKGDLSLVGPRPPLQTEVEQYEGWHRRKLSVKPGITCLWQISGRNEISDFDDWMKLDLKYIDEWSLWLDLKILFSTIPAVIKGSGR